MAKSNINKKHPEKAKSESGLSLVEIILAITIFAIFSIGVFYASLDNLAKSGKVALSSEALRYAQEGIEAAKHMRNLNYLSLTNGDHGLSFAGNNWTFIPAPEDIDGFYERTLTIQDVYRDISGNIAPTGNLDPELKKVISEVSWLERNIFPRSVFLTGYIGNWTADDNIQTTCADFTAGTFTDMESVTTAAPPDDNCALKLTLQEAGSSFFNSVDLGEHGRDVVVNSGYAYVVNAKAQQGLSVVDIQNPQSPAIIGNVDINGKGRAVAYDSGYVYAAVENSNKGLAIINVSNPASPTLASYLDVGEKGNALAVNGNTLYFGIDDDSDSLAVINITNKSSPSIIRKINFSSEVLSLFFNNGNLYVGLDDDWNGFRVMDLTDPTFPVQIAGLSIGEEVNEIYVSGPYAYAGIENDSNSLKIINIVNPQSPSIVQTLDAGGEIQALSRSGDYLYAALDNENAGLAAINISDPLNAYLVYNSDLDGKGTGIFADAQYVYLTLDTGNKGLVITGTTVTQANTTGNYISAIIDTGSSDTRYNFIEWDHAEVPGATVSLLIRTASSPENIASAPWVGSDGTINTSYQNSRTQIITAPDTTGSRYLQFKVTIASSGAADPLIESIRINFTP